MFSYIKKYYKFQRDSIKSFFKRWGEVEFWDAVKTEKWWRREKLRIAMDDATKVGRFAIKRIGSTYFVYEQTPKCGYWIVKHQSPVYNDSLMWATNKTNKLKQV